MQFVFPLDYGNRDCFLVAIDASIIPLVAGALQMYEERRNWHDDAEYERAYNAFAELQACMTKTCLSELIESNNRIYRLLDAGIFGRTYDVISEDPLIVEPAIPPVPDLSTTGDGLIGQVNNMQLMLRNALNGDVFPSAGYTNPRGVKPLLEELIEQSGGLSDEEKAQLFQKLLEIAAALI